MRLVEIIRSIDRTQRAHAFRMLGLGGKEVELPPALVQVMENAASLIAEGHSVSVIADDEMLTTQQAADSLNVSRQFVTRLVDRGDLPAVKVGSHRRLRVQDVQAYRLSRDAQRDGDLDALAALSEEMGGYTLR